MKNLPILIVIVACVLSTNLNGCAKSVFVGPPGQTGASGEKGDVGQQGPVGLQGLPGIPGTLVQPEVFCPNLPGAFPEAYLRFSNTVIVAQYYDGQGRSQLTMLVPGTYITTDNRNCLFTVDANYDIVY